MLDFDFYGFEMVFAEFLVFRLSFSPEATSYFLNNATFCPKIFRVRRSLFFEPFFVISEIVYHPAYDAKRLYFLFFVFQNSIFLLVVILECADKYT
jgi:hypothetical protein